MVVVLGVVCIVMVVADVKGDPPEVTFRSERKDVTWLYPVSLHTFDQTLDILLVAASAVSDVVRYLEEPKQRFVTGTR